jgi:glycosyltransferase involved in cell wall biosynthesis
MRDFDQVRRMITAFDVGLAWCTDRTESSRCRSPLKALQYGAAGVPVVASSTVYGELPGLADEYGLVVDGTGDLAEALVKALSTSHEMMQKRAKDWRDAVWDHHSYETQALRWLDVIEITDSDEPTAD